MAIKAILCGEAWGKSEDVVKHPVVGATGRELSLELGAAGFAPYLRKLCRKCKQETLFIAPHCQHCREHLWPNEYDLIDHWKRLRQMGIAVTNVFQERPPDNDLMYFFGSEPEEDFPSYRAANKVGHIKSQHFHHLKRLWNEIETLKPNLVVAMGNSACWALLEQTKITTLRGTINWSQRCNVKVLPTFHTAAVLRRMTLRATTIADYTKAAREREFPELRRPERWILQLDPTEQGISDGYEWFRKPARAYANDIETYRNLITMSGFARSSSDIMVIPFRGLDGNYWPTSELEFKAWKLLQFGLQTPAPKIFQNGLFDMSYYLRMGLGIRNAYHDTMLWHHSEYPELPKSLGFLGSIYANDVAWKQIHTFGAIKRDE